MEMNTYTHRQTSVVRPVISQEEFRRQTWVLAQYQSVNFAIADVSGWHHVIWSLTCHSGFWSSHYIEAVINQIQSGRLNLIHHVEQVYVVMEIEKGDTNVRRENGDAVREMVLPLHPITLALIGTLKRTTHSTQKIIREFEKSLTQGAPQSMTFKQFCRASVFVFEHLCQRSVPEHLIQAQSGLIATSPLPLAYFSTPLRSMTTLPIAAPKSLFEPKPFQAGEVTSNLNLFKNLKRVITEANTQERPCADKLARVLSALKDTCRTIAETVLLDWYIHKLLIDKIGVSSLTRYHCAISRRWLSVFEHCDIQTYSSDELEKAYEFIIASCKTESNTRYVARRLYALHQFAHQVHGIAPATVESVKFARRHVRAAIIGETDFALLLEQVQYHDGLSYHEKRILQCVLILIYRCAFRPSEVSKFRINDIERAMMWWLYVRPNQYGSDKSESARRKIPSAVLIPDQEKRIIESYINDRFAKGGNKTDLLFHAEHSSKVKIDIGAISTWTSQIMTQLTGRKTDCLYSLRHSVVNRFYLILNDIEHFPEWVEYSPSELARLKQTLVMADRNNCLFQVAGFAGHQSPEVTYRHYIHTHFVLLGRCMQALNLTLTVKQMRNLKLSQTQGFGLAANPMRYQQAMKRVIQQWDVKSVELRALERPDVIVIIEAGFSLRYVEQCVATLAVMLQGCREESTDTPYPTSPELLEQLQALTLPKALQTVHCSLPRKQQEKKLLNRLVKTMNKYDLSDSKHFKEMLAYLQTHFPRSKPGLYFSSPRKLKRFLSLIEPIKIQKSLFVHLTNHTNQRNAQRWKNALGGMEVRKHLTNPRQKQSSVMLYVDGGGGESSRVLWVSLLAYGVFVGG